MRLQHPAPFTARWRARWIWSTSPAITFASVTLPVLADPIDRVALLRRTFPIDTVPDRAPCRIWSDGRHLLHVNGEIVARGPVRADPRLAHYDVVDLAPAPATRGPTCSPSPPGTSAAPPRGGCPRLPRTRWERAAWSSRRWWVRTWVVSDDSWRAAPGAAWSPVPNPGDVACLPIESFDARAHPHGWTLPSFDDGDWHPATEIIPVHTGATARSPSPQRAVRGAAPAGAGRPSPTGPPTTPRRWRTRPDRGPLRSTTRCTRSWPTRREAAGLTAERPTLRRSRHLAFDFESVVAGTVELEVAVPRPARRSTSRPPSTSTATAVWSRWASTPVCGSVRGRRRPSASSHST